MFVPNRTVVDSSDVAIWWLEYQPGQYYLLLLTSKPVMAFPVYFVANRKSRTFLRVSQSDVLQLMPEAMVQGV